MSDTMIPELPETTSSEAASPAAMTAGQIIREARLQKGVHLAVLSVNLKVPVRQLEALEADQYDVSKGPVFVRALASSVCRQLQIDPTLVLSLLPQSADRMPLQKPTLESLSSTRQLQPEIQNFLRSIPLQTVGIAAVMLSLIAALLWMPSPSNWSWLKSEPPNPASAEPVMPVMPPLAQAPAEPASLPASTLPNTGTTVTPPVTPAVPQAAVVAAPAIVNPVASLPAAGASVPSSQAGAVMAFNATNDSWIEIRDGKNKVLWSRVVQAGETAQVQFPPPMNVVVGRAHVVSVTYKGQPFDLTPHTKVTVARFEVKE
jgi:cytoskeleton protein RodZ